MAQAPTYDLNTPAGQMYLSGTLNMGGSGQLASGVNAFLGNDYQPTGSRGNGSDGWDPSNISYNIDPMLALGDKMGYTGDASKLRGISGGGPVFNPDGSITPATQGYDQNTNEAYQQYSAGLNDYLKDYVNVSGMSSAWDGNTEDPRSAASTLYRNEGNVLTPQGDPRFYHARERGSWAQENQDGVMAALILGGGFLGGSALAAYGAGTGAGATGAAAAGSTGSSGLGGLAGSLQGWYAGLPGYAQGALSGAGQGALSSAIQGQNPLKGGAIGALTGGLGAWGGGALAGATGMPGWAARAITSAGTGGLGAGLSGGDWKRGALAGGLGSLAGSGLSGAGLDSPLAGKLVGMAGSYGANSLLGGAPGGSGGVGSQQARSAAPSPGGVAGIGMSGGVSSRWDPGLTQGEAGNAQFVRASGEPIRQEAAREALLERIKNDPELLARLRDRLA